MDNELLEEIHMMRNHAKRTREVYKDAVNKYTTFCSMSLEELLKEAEAEEDAGIKWKKKKIKKKIVNIQTTLVGKLCIEYSQHSFKTYFNNIQIF